MIIEKIEIQDVKGLTHLEIANIPGDGVFRISGENERGKSTIMEALYIFFKYSRTSTDKEVRALKPVDRDVAPRVSVTMRLEEYHLTMTKQWLKKPRAELIIDEPWDKADTQTGEDAENLFADILNKHVDENLRSILFVRQGAALSESELSGIPPLIDAIQEDVDSPSDSEILELATKECNKYLQPTRRHLAAKNKVLYRAEKQLKQCSENYTIAKQKEQDLQATFEEAREAAVTRVQIEEEELPKARRLLSEREKELQTIKELQEQVKAAEESVRRMARDAEHAQENLDSRISLDDDVVQREESIRTLSSALEEVSLRAKEAVEKHQKAQEDYQAAKEAFEEAQASVDKVNELVEGSEDAEKLAHNHLSVLEQREQKARDLEAVEDSEGRLVSAESARPETTLTESQFTEIEKAHRDVEVKRSSLQESSATMSFTGRGVVEADGEQFTLNGEPVEITLLNGTVLRIGDLEARYSSGTKGPTRQDVEAAQLRYRELLSQAGVEDLEQAREAKDQTLNAERLVEQYQQELKTILHEKGSVEEIKQQIAQLDSDLEEAGFPQVSLEQARTAYETAQSQLASAKADKKRAEQKQREAEKAREVAEKKEKETLPQKFEEERIAADSKVKAAEEELTSAKKKRDEAEAKKSRESLERECAQAQTKKLEAEEQYQQLVATLAEAEPEKTRETKDQAYAAVERLEAHLAQTNTRYDRALGGIEKAEGVEGECAQAKMEKESAERHLAGVKARADAARLLEETLKKKQLEARRKYSETFRNVITQLAEQVFGPNVDFQLNNNLAITARVRDGKKIDLNQLSGGAREQLDLLTRLAIAKIAGKHVPVFLDDALGSTDAERLKRIGGLLGDTGKDTQVFVLTCEPERFDSVSDIHEYPMDKIAPRPEGEEPPM